MEHLLSDCAKRKRREDFRDAANKNGTMGLVYLICIALLLWALQTVKKLPQGQKAALAFLIVSAGGFLVYITMQYNLWGLSLVVMFFLGWLLSELSRL